MVLYGFIRFLTVSHGFLRFLTFVISIRAIEGCKQPTATSHPQGQPTASRERKHFRELFTSQDGIIVLGIITQGGRSDRPALKQPITNQ